MFDAAEVERVLNGDQEHVVPEPDQQRFSEKAAPRNGKVEKCGVPQLGVPSYYGSGCFGPCGRRLGPESYDLLQQPSARSRVSFDEVVARQYAAANVVWAEEVSDSGVGLSS